jgi:hypothetical protein
MRILKNIVFLSAAVILSTSAANADRVGIDRLPKCDVIVQPPKVDPKPPGDVGLFPPEVEKCWAECKQQHEDGVNLCYDTHDPEIIGDDDAACQAHVALNECLEQFNEAYESCVNDCLKLMPPIL